MTPHEIRSLIDRITDALGPAATPAKVEEIARAVISAEQSSMPEPTVSATVGEGPITGRILVTAFGCDQPGILSAITTELQDLNVSVLDVSQKVLQGYFSLILLADIAGSGTTPKVVQDRLTPHAERLDVRIIVQHEELFHAMNRL